MRKTIAVIASLAVASGCTTSSKEFYKNPSKPESISLCRTFLESKDKTFKSDIERELARRGVDTRQCKPAVDQENAKIAAGIVVAAAVVGVAAVCANNGGCGGGGGGYSNAADWDQFYSQYGQLVWACREIYTGRFTYESNCYGLPKNDFRWPSKRA